MALEEEDFREDEKVLDSQKQPSIKVEDAPMSESQVEMIRQLQKQVEMLQQNQNQNQNQNGGGITPEFLERLVRGIQGPQAKTGQFEFDTMYSEEDIDPDDTLPKEEWVTFVCHRVMHIIVDDQRNGRNIRAPFDKIVFTYDSTKRVTNGKETELINLSTYTCKSRKELAWLRSHTKFGIYFFDSIDGSMSQKAERASLLVRVMLQLGRMGQHQIIQMCRERGLPITKDLNEMRSNIALVQVEEQLEKVRSSFVKSMDDQLNEAVLIGKADEIAKKG